jgi:dTDP-4-dehydrorhamnose 3,5-epimerase
MNKDILLNSLRIIDTKGGNVMHAMKKVDLGYVGFGEAYFSEIEFESIKAWKRHKEMTLNLIVPVGKVRFALFDDRENKMGERSSYALCRDSYSRLTVPPMVWVGFQGLEKGVSIILNIADIIHDPNEVERKNIDEIEFNWTGE